MKHTQQPEALLVLQDGPYIEGWLLVKLEQPGAKFASIPV